jgi:hypothetical protein
LFPWADGYSVMGGACSHADPLGESAPGVPIWVGADRPAPIEAVPGGSSPVTVLLPEIDVTVRRDLGAGPVPIAGAAVEVRHAADDGCPAGVTHDFGTTNASGRAARAIPFGVWGIYVNGVLYDTVSLDPSTDWSTPTSVSVLLP